MKLLYFTLEDIRTSLFNNQVLEMLLARKAKNSLEQITLFIINKPSSLKGLSVIKEKVGNRIKIIYVPLSPPMRYYTSSIWINKIYIFLLKKMSQYSINVLDYDVIHCRHYLPALVMKELGANNIHFDVRSLSLFEYVAAGKIEKNSDIYKYWLNQEKELIKFCAGVSVVSKSMLDYFGKYRNDINYCPIVVNFENFIFSTKSRNERRSNWGWENRCVYVYSGSFGLYGLNKDALAKLIKHIFLSDKNSSFLFLLSNNQFEFDEFIRANALTSIDYLYYSVSPENIASYLSAADVGIHALPLQLDSITRLGTKIVEYWAMGIPTYITSTIGEAAQLSNLFGLGEVIDLENAIIANYVFNPACYDRELISSKTKSVFSIESVLKEYDKSYNLIRLKNGASEIKSITC